MGSSRLTVVVVGTGLYCYWDGHYVRRCRRLEKGYNFRGQELPAGRIQEILAAEFEEREG
jgi:hypothetical protein